MFRRLIEDGCPARARWRRARLRHAALTYARHDWKVLAGARLCGKRFSCGPGCRTRSCHPVAAGWEPTSDTQTILHRWRHSPFSVLLATGDAFDAVEVPAHIGALAQGALRGPVVVTPAGQWIFLVRPGEPLHPELTQHHDVVLHGPGSWIPAPPVRTPRGPVRWAVTPYETDWRLPDGSLKNPSLARKTRSSGSDSDHHGSWSLVGMTRGSDMSLQNVHHGIIGNDCPNGVPAFRWAGTRPMGARPIGSRPAGSRPAGTHRPVR
jgi:hypothetical protein